MCVIWMPYPCSIRINHSRVAAVGPDRAAAEWVLRLGGSVKFTDFDYWNLDYNRLPSGGRDKLKLEQIDGTGTSITPNGLEHLGWSNTMVIHEYRLREDFS